MNLLRWLPAVCLSALLAQGQDPTAFQSLWRSTFDASGFDGAAQVALDGQGNLFVAGSTATTDAASDGLLIKVSPSGQRLWARRFDSAISETDFFSALAVDSAGNPAVVGMAAERDAPSSLVVASYDAATGANRWTKQFPGKHVSAGSVAIDPPTGAVIAMAAIETPTGQTLRTYKFASNGTPQWTNQLPAARDITFALTGRLPLLVAPDGGCFLATLTTSARGDLDWLLVRLRANGTEQWRITAGGTNFESQPLLTLHSSGDLLLAGSSENESGALDILIQRINPSNGTRVWQNKFRGASVFKSGSHVPVEIRSFADGSILLAGNSPGWGGFISRFTSAGVFQWTTHFPQTAVAAIPLPDGRTFVSVNVGVGWVETNGTVLKYEDGRQSSVPIADAAGNVFLAGSYYKPEAAGDFGLFAEKLTLNRHSLAPRFTKLAEITGGFPGNSLLLAPEVSGPNLVYTWTHNGVPIPGAKGPTFFIPSLDATTIGFYSLHATNNFGETLCPDIEVLTARPIFLVQPKPQTLVTGGDVAFSALAVGFEPQVADFGNYLTYQWFTGNFAIPGQTRSKLVIRNANADWIGSYWVRATIFYPEIQAFEFQDSAVVSLTFPIEPVQEIWRDEFILFNEPWTIPTGMEMSGTSVVAVSLQSPDMLDRANIANKVVLSDTVETFAPATLTLPKGPHYKDSKGDYYAMGETNRLDTGVDWVVARHLANGTLVWQQTVGSLGREPDFVVDAAVDGKDNLIITGWSASEATGRDALTVAVKKEDGALLWRSVFHDPNGVRVPYAGEQPAVLALDQSGNTFVAGNGFWATNGFNFLVSYDTNGVERFSWRRGWDLPIEEAPKLAVDHEGNAILAGSFGLMKIDPTGRVLWVKDLRSSPLEARPLIYGLKADRAGNIFISGHGTLGGVFLKYDHFGILIYQSNILTTFPETLFEPSGRFFLDDFGNIYLPGTGGNAVSEQDILLVKLNAEFTRLWSARVDGVDRKSDKALDVRVVGADIFVTGQVTDKNTLNASVAQMRETPWPFRVMDISKSRTIRRGTTLRLEAQAFGNVFFYQWYKNFQFIPGANTPTFDIPNASSNQEGFYFLQAGDGTFSVISGGFSIRVADPPLVVTSPGPTNVLVNGQIRLNATVTGTEPLFYQWQFNAANLAGATNLSLNIDGAQFHHRGNYRLVVSNAWGTATGAAATVNVTAPVNLAPTIKLAEPAERFVQRDLAPVRLRAAVYDADGRVVQVIFKVNGAAIATVFLKGYETLWTPPGPGIYKVSAQAMDDKQAITESATVEVVIAPKPSFTQQGPATLNVAENADIVLRANATSTPPPRYQWRLNGARIPGATNETYTIGGAQPRHSGRYSVLVINEGSAVISTPTEVIVAAPSVELNDQLANSIFRNDVQFTARGHNRNATKENNEPRHAKRTGGKSVWIGWQAPNSGVMTVSTRGSAFDTLLGIYSGGTFPLTLQAADDERGGFHCSIARFNAVKDQEYYIAVDGLNGQSGNIVLSWTLDTSARTLPVITDEPISLSRASNASFFINAEGAGLKFQWFLNGYPIPGATASGIFIENVKPQLGDYVVRVSNDAGSVESEVAELEQGSGNEPVTQDRVEDLLAPSAGGGGDIHTAAAVVYPTLSPGIPYSKSFNTTGATTDSNEPVTGEGGGASKWYLLNAAGAGTLVADTIGSDFPNVITLHDPAFPETLPVLALGQPLPGGASRVQFPATAGGSYLVRVDGLNEQEGNVILNATIGAAPVFNSPPADQVIALGANTNLNAAVTASPTAQFQWYLNGSLLPGKTSPTLQITSFDPAQAGAYALQASNPLGSIMQTVAYVEVERPFFFDEVSKLADGSLQLRLEGNTKTYFIDFSRDFANWTNVFSGRAENGTLEYTDPPAPTQKYRFYRAR